MDNLKVLMKQSLTYSLESCTWKCLSVNNQDNVNAY